jgi:hypothetical protein
VPSSLFRCSSQKLSAAELPFSPEILESWTTTCRKNSGVPRCFPLFFAVLDIHPTSPGILLTFARDNPALSPDMGAVPALLFLQRIDRRQPFRCDHRAVLSMSSYS